MFHSEPLTKTITYRKYTDVSDGNWEIGWHIYGANVSVSLLESFLDQACVPFERRRGDPQEPAWMWSTKNSRQIGCMTISIYQYYQVLVNISRTPSSPCCCPVLRDPPGRTWHLWPPSERPEAALWVALRESKLSPWSNQVYPCIRRPRQTQGGARQGIRHLTLVSDYYHFYYSIL